MNTASKNEEEAGLSLERARTHLAKWGREGDIILPEVSTATVELAAQALGVGPERIAKTLSLHAEDGGAVVVVVAGDARLDNKKFRAEFGYKPRMLSHEDAERFTGHAVGGVCPFGLPEGTPVFLDRSLKRFATVFPACGTANSAIELTLPELFEYSRALGWADVCREPC
jgi:prolyl-tRNA editing enzyme YbaK/EbsC (Cys-tRNA(Pro) deacylase)